MSAATPTLPTRPARWPYLVVTGLFVVFMAFGAALDLARTPDAIAFMTHLGYPVYFVRYIGTLKVLGLVAVVLPGWPRLKEWAYAGLFFDTTGALYSAIANGDTPDTWVPAALGVALMAASYGLYRRPAATAAQS